MYFGKSPRRGQSGNAVIYILIALALLGALTVAITRSNDNASSDLSKEQAEIFSTRLSAYSAAVDNVIDQMIMSGTDVYSIDYTLPSQASFVNGVHSLKLFHPNGGGITQPMPDPAFFDAALTNPKAGWYIGRPGNVEWTPTTARDIVIAAYGLNRGVCEVLNKQITGSATIPVIVGTGFPQDYFVLNTGNHSRSNANFLITVCPACEGQSTMCVANTGSTIFTYYSIIEGL